MRLDYDEDADAIYVHLRDVPYAFGEDLDPERRIDYAADGKPLGIELLNVSSGVNLDRLPDVEAVSRLLTQHGVKILAPQP